MRVVVVQVGGKCHGVWQKVRTGGRFISAPSATVDCRNKTPCEALKLPVLAKGLLQGTDQPLCEVMTHTGSGTAVCNLV